MSNGKGRNFVALNVDNSTNARRCKRASKLKVLCITNKEIILATMRKAVAEAVATAQERELTQA